jgi:hypothetical protein
MAAGDLHALRQRSYYRRSASAKFAAVLVFEPISALLVGLLSENEGGQLSLCPGRLSNSENVV